MAPKRRWIVLLLLLGASNALVALSPGSGGADGSVEAIPKKTVPEADKAGRDKGAAGKEEEASMIEEIRPRAPASAMARAFAVRDWAPPPAPAAPSNRPPPTAPPLPLVFLGKELEDGNWRIFLGQEDKIHIVKEKDLIDDIYRVDAIRPPLMAITYLPLQQRQTLDIRDP